MDALASWNCRLLLYNLVDVYDIEIGLSTQFLRYFSKEQTSNLQSHVFLRCMLLVSEKYIAYLRDLLSTCTACKLCKRWVNCLVPWLCCNTNFKQLLCKLTKCKKCLYSIIINQAKLYNLYCCCIMLDVTLKIILLHYCMVLTSLPSSWLKF
jgi:hypothetical protein